METPLPTETDDESFYLLVDRELRNEVSEEELDYLDAHLDRWRVALTDKLIASEQHLHNLNTDLHLWRMEQRSRFNYRADPRALEIERRMLGKISATTSFLAHVRRRLLHIRDMLRERYQDEQATRHRQERIEFAEVMRTWRSIQEEYTRLVLQFEKNRQHQEAGHAA